MSRGYLPNRTTLTGSGHFDELWLPNSFDDTALESENCGMQSPKEFPDLYTKAVRNSNVDEFVKLFEEDVRIFDMWDEWSANGANSCRQMATEWFSSLGKEHVQVSFFDIEISESPTIAFLTGFVRFSGHAEDGKQLRFLDERMTIILRRQKSGEWKVAHQHMSGPVNSPDMKVKLRRAE
jgi:ketosteroid isomerase-like protein